MFFVWQGAWACTHLASRLCFDGDASFPRKPSDVVPIDPSDSHDSCFSSDGARACSHLKNRLIVDRYANNPRKPSDVAPIGPSDSHDSCFRRHAMNMLLAFVSRRICIVKN